MKHDGTPRKRSRRPLKHKTDETEKIAIAVSEQKIIENLITDALSGMLENFDMSEPPVDTRDNLDAMILTCSEFLNNFIIIGYDLAGNPIQPILHAKKSTRSGRTGSVSTTLSAYNRLIHGR